MLEETSKSLEIYKEFYINGLDLLSLILMTPKLFRAFASSVYKIVRYLYVNALVAITASLATSKNQIIIIAVILANLIYIFGPGLLLLLDLYTKGSLRRRFNMDEKAWDKVDDVALIGGFLLFLFARGIAFMIAYYELRA